MSQVTATIKRRGGEARGAAIAGAARSTPYRWQQEKSSAGTADLPLRAYHRGLPDYANGTASLENMQRSCGVSERTGSRLDQCARAGSWNNQSEDCDALGASARCLLLGERGTPQNAVRKMKVAESIDIEFLQAERLQDFFALHRRRPVPNVMNYPATTEGCRTRQLFLWALFQLQMRMQRKINECVNGRGRG
jgi:hypothetical protein